MTSKSLGIGVVSVVLALAGCAGSNETDDSSGTSGGGASGGGASSGGAPSGGSTSSGGAPSSGGASSGGAPSGGSTSSGGAPSGGGAGGGGADPCELCLESSCSAQLAACDANAECVAMGQCYESCADDACYQACFDAHPSAQALDDAILECMSTSCGTQCQ